MNSAVRQFIRAARQAPEAHLTPAERQRHWAAIERAMRQQPMQHWPSRSWFERLTLPNFATGLAVALILLMVGGGVSFAAGSSLPGDVLYPIKVHVVENIQAVLAVTPTAKAQAALQRVHQRLQEAEALRQKGQLTAQQETNISQNLSVATEQARREATKLEAKKQTTEADDVSQRLEDTLQQSRQQLSSSAPSNTTSAAVKLAKTLKTDQEAAVVKKRQAASKALDDVITILNSDGHFLSVSQFNQTQDELAIVAGNMVTAQVMSTNGNLAKSFQLYTQILRTVQTIKHRILTATHESKKSSAVHAQNNDRKSFEVKAESTPNRLR